MVLLLLDSAWPSNLIKLGLSTWCLHSNDQMMIRSELIRFDSSWSVLIWSERRRHWSRSSESARCSPHTHTLLITLIHALKFALFWTSNKFITQYYYHHRLHYWRLKFERASERYVEFANLKWPRTNRTSWSWSSSSSPSPSDNNKSMRVAAQGITITANHNHNRKDGTKLLLDERAGKL